MVESKQWWWICGNAVLLVDRGGAKLCGGTSGVVATGSGGGGRLSGYTMIPVKIMKNGSKMLVAVDHHTRWITYIYICKANSDEMYEVEMGRQTLMSLLPK